MLLADHSAAKKAYGDLSALAEAVFYARDLVTEPGNILNPETYADRLKDLSKQGLEVEVLTVKDMKKLGMGSLLGVGQGSNSESRVVILRWNGGKDGVGAGCLRRQGRDLRFGRAVAEACRRWT